MSHFTIRKIIPKNEFFNGIAQIGKKFFYDLDVDGFPIDNNTIINYEYTLALSYNEFLQLIKDITGFRCPTELEGNYEYHLPKSDNLINKNYCINKLGFPDEINGYELTTIGIAANYSNKKEQTGGNILFIFCDPASPDNEVCFSIHIQHSNKKTNYLNSLKSAIHDAVNELKPKNSIWTVKPWNSFYNIQQKNFNKSASYVVTKGHQEEINYKNSYSARNQISKII